MGREQMATHGDTSDGLDALQQPEFSRIISVADLSGAQTRFSFDASPRELAALSERLGVDALEMLKIHAEMQILSTGDVLANMSFSARLAQHCVVTLEPLKSDISYSFTTSYSDDADADWGHGEEEFEDLDADIEPPEPLVNGKIDIGEACVEQLALEIDPFPRVQGATFEDYSTGSIGDAQGQNLSESARKNPFAVLSNLKTQKENGD
jgi:uncharacterized metal-binding protein YceD (DUF177 family)